MENHGIGIVCLAFAAFAAVAAGTSTPAGFTDDLDAAMKRAQANGRKILTVFSGSDWCIWCKEKIDEEIRFGRIADKHIPLSDASGGSSGAQSFQIAPVADTATAR